MVLSLSRAAARLFIVFVAFVIAIALSYFSVRNALAVYYAGLNTLEGLERAARLEPSDARNWYLLGRYWQYNLENPDGQKAILNYQKSLSLDPHSADAWSDLAMAYESENNLPAARAAYLQAQRTYPLSPEVAWRFGNFLLRRGELDSAFVQIRRAVEVDPKRGAAAFALCMRVDPDITAVLDHALPPSRDAYLSIITALAEQQRSDQALLVWSRLMELQPRLSLTDANPLIETLLYKKQMAEAQRVWDQAVAAAGVIRPPGPAGSLVWDGGFETNIVNAGLAWRYAPFASGVHVALDSREKHSGRQSLRLIFNGLRNVDFQDVCQYIAVQPSTNYSFSAWVQARSLSTDQGVRFALNSITYAGASKLWTDDIRGTQAWTPVRLPWSSGSDVHELKLCISRLPSTKFDSKIRGTAWVDDVILAPETRENTQQ